MEVVDQISAAKRRSIDQSWVQCRRDAHSTAAADREAAEHHVRVLYREAKLSEPEQIVWVDGPQQLIARRRSRLAPVAGPTVGPLIFDRPLQVTAQDACNKLSNKVTVDLASALPLDFRRWRMSAIEAFGQHWSLSAKPSVWASLLANTYSRPAWAPLERAAWMQFDAPQIWSYAIISDVLGVELRGAWRSLWELTRSMGCCVPHERICWLMERPDEVAFDAAGHLHAASGPALRYRDGWSHYSWKGVAVPPSLIDAPESIDLDQIDRARDPRLRRCMIDIVTPPAFIANGGAERIATDAHGTLWRRDWAFDSWQAVEVINGTAEPDGSYKHYFLQVPSTVRTPLEAVAWTYGMDPRKYASISKRT